MRPHLEMKSSRQMRASAGKQATELRTRAHASPNIWHRKLKVTVAPHIHWIAPGPSRPNQAEVESTGVQERTSLVQTAIMQNTEATEPSDTHRPVSHVSPARDRRI